MFSCFLHFAQIPGFSSYLHPINIEGVSLMLGIGQSVDESNGWSEGVKISLFNITNPERPTELATLVDLNAYSNAEHDFKSFRYLPLTQKLILPKSEYTWRSDGNFDGFVVYDVNLTAITPRYQSKFMHSSCFFCELQTTPYLISCLPLLVSHASSNDIFNGCWYDAYMPPRSLVFKSKVTTILSHTVISTDLETGTEEWTLNLDDGVNNTICGRYFVMYY